MTDAVAPAQAPATAPAAPMTAASSLAAAPAPVSQTAPTGGTPEEGAGASQPTQSAPDTQSEPTLKLPPKDATPEQWAEFYKQIGAPDSPDAYELPVPEGDPGEFAKTAASWFKDAGLLPQQAQALAAKWNEFQAAQSAAAQQAEQQRLAALDSMNRAEEAALKNEWSDRFDANMELGRRAVRQFLPSEQAGDVIAAIEDKIGYAATMKLFSQIGQGLGEHDAAGLGGSALRPDMTPMQSLAARMYGPK